MPSGLERRSGRPVLVSTKIVRRPDATTAVPRGDRTSAGAVRSRCDHAPFTGSSVRGSSGASVHHDPLCATPTTAGVLLGAAEYASAAHSDTTRVTTQTSRPTGGANVRLIA